MHSVAALASSRRRQALGLLGWPLALAVRAADAFEWRPWPRGKRAPPLAGPLAGGGNWRLDEQRGQVVLANFWASWCAPCRDEMPSLVRLAAQRQGDGLRAVGVNYRESAATVARFLDGLGVALPTLLDPNGELAASYTPRIFPSTVVFDRQGRAVGTVVGEIDWGGAAAGRILAPLLGGS